MFGSYSHSGIPKFHSGYSAPRSRIAGIYSGIHSYSGIFPNERTLSETRIFDLFDEHPRPFHIGVSLRFKYLPSKAILQSLAVCQVICFWEEVRYNNFFIVKKYSNSNLQFFLSLLLTEQTDLAIFDYSTRKTCTENKCTLTCNEKHLGRPE